ncbi:MAG: NAD(P)/FAD-dependent oxidoreductase [Nocardioides sp.]
MAPESAQVVIIGGGLEGCAAAWQLSRRGVTDILVLERDTVGGGMTGKSSGIVRCHYGVSSLAAMANYGLDVFEQAESLFGEDIGFRNTGYVVGVGQANAAALRASLAAQQAVGVQTEEIEAAEVAKLWPWADLEPFAAFGWEARGGYGDAYQTAQAYAKAARQAGVEIRQGAEVASLKMSSDQVSGVRLASGEEISAGQVVVATGCWSGPFLAKAGVEVPVRVHRESIVMINPGVDLGRVPVFSDLISLQYVRPDVGGQILFGNSDLGAPNDADPDWYPNRADEQFIERTVDKVGTRFPRLADASITTTYSGCYDVTPDWNPIISLTEVAGLVVAAGFSGHGFKISAAVGRLVADLVIDAASSDPLVPESDFRLSRYAEGDPTVTPFPYAGAGSMR